MATPIESVSASQGQGPIASGAVFSVDATAQASAVGQVAGPQSAADIKVSTLGDLAKTPEGQKFMSALQESIARQMIGQQKASNERVIKAMKEGRRNG